MLEVWSGPFGAAAHAAFVADFWQKRPLLVRGFLPPDALEAYCPLSKDALINLACAADTPARLVRESGGARPWECRRGPFDAADFAALAADGSSPPWTLLVSRVDQLSRSVEALREAPELFGFVPRWRVDDVMVSYAPAGGSVGAHLDNYDVFLVQGRGTREWSVEGEPRAAKSEALVPGLDVRLLAEFEPAVRWELKPGDALYIPPRYAHHGTPSHILHLTPCILHLTSYTPLATSGRHLTLP